MVRSALKTNDEVGGAASGGVAPPRRVRSSVLDSDRVYCAVLWLIGAAAAALALVHLGRAPLWMDEAWTSSIVDRSFVGLLRDLAHKDVNMALYYVIAYGWVAISHSDTWLRSLSVLFAALAVVVVGATVGRVLSRSAGVVAAILLAVNPLFLIYARQARAYSMVLLLSALSWYFLVRGWWNEGRRPWRVAYVLCVLATVATHVIALLVVPIQVAVVLIVRRTKGRSALVYGAAGVAPAGLLLLYVLLNNGSQTSWIERPNLEKVHAFLRSFIGGDHWFLMYGAVIAFGLVASFLWGRPVDRVAGVAGLVAFVGPIVMLWIVSQVRPLFVDRYLIFILPPLVFLLALGMVRAPGGIAVVAVLTAGLALHSFHMDRPWIERTMYLEDIRTAARQVATEGRPDDALLFDPAWSRPGFEHFSRAMALSPRDVALAPGGRHDDEVLVSELKPAEIEARLQGVKRVWVVGYGQNGWAIAPEPAASVRAQHVGRDWVPTEYHSYGSFEVTLYQVVPANQPDQPARSNAQHGPQFA